MSAFDNADHFFQTSHSVTSGQRKATKAKNKFGNPIRLPSKILAVQRNPINHDAVYVAESAGEIKNVDLEIGKATSLRTQFHAPITSLAIFPSLELICAGSWDKNIRLISTAKPPSSPPKILSGHTDFVKCLIATSLGGKPVLISGGADANIIVWDITALTMIHKLRLPTSSALQDLAIDPGDGGPTDGLRPTDSIVLFSASSGRDILRWHISLDSACEITAGTDGPVRAHETSVYKLCFDSEGDLWTASADNTAKHLVRSRDWEADTVLKHADFVRDVVVVEEMGIVVTACRDEEVRVWDSGSGDLRCVYSGHWEEVTGLTRVGEKGQSVVSVGIDGTVRKWGLDQEAMNKYIEERKINESSEGGDGDGEKREAVLTAEEEAELAELMDDE